MGQKSYRLFVAIVFLACSFPVAAQEPSALTGVILEEPDRPLAGARVELVPVLPLYEAGRVRIGNGGLRPETFATTGPEGRFRIPVPRQGAWKVVARAPGRVPMQYGPLLVVEPEPMLPSVLLPRDVGAAVAVLDEAGRPVADAWVLASDAEEAAAARRTGIWRIEPRAGRTGAEGTVTLPRKEGLPLELRVLPPGRGEVVRQGFTGGTITLAGESAPSPSVRVEADSGEPAAGVQVRIGELNWPIGETDGQGTLRLPVSGSQPVRLRLVAADGRQQVATLAAASGQTSRIFLARPRRLTGRLVDEATRKGLGGALLSPDTDPGALLRTDRDGRYELTLPWPGRLTLDVKAPGYLPKRLTFTSADLRTGILPSVSLERANPLTGLVSDAGRKPLAWVTIEAVPRALLGPRLLSPREPVADRTTTDATGRFTLRRLCASEVYEIRARRTGYVPAALLTAIAPGDPGRLQIRLQLSLARPVQGRIVDSESRPIADAVVDLRPALRPGSELPDLRTEPDLSRDDSARGVSDGQGRFQVAACPAEEFDVRVTRPGFAPAYRRGIRAAGGQGPIELEALVLEPGARLAGRVVDAQSRPVPDAEIFVLSSTPGGLEIEGPLKGRKPDTLTDQEGRFEIPSLAQRVPYHLVARAAGYLPAVLSGIRPPTDRPLSIRLQRGETLRGRVVDEEGAPVQGARVDLTWRDVLSEDPQRRPVGKPVTRNAVTDGEGQFEILGSPKGVVTLDVTAQGFAFLGGVEVPVPAPDPSRKLELVLSRGSTLSGRVTTTAGEPVAQARIASESAAGWSDAEGFYRVEGMSEGRQPIQVFHPDYRRSRSLAVIEPGENRLDLVLAAGMEVAGRVVDSSGKPVARAEVKLTSQERERQQYQAFSGEDGHFSLRSVAAGEYRLQAEAGESGQAEPAGTIRVAQEPVTGLEVVLRTGAALSGRVLGLSPEELSSLGVEARKDGGKTLPGRVNGEGYYEIRGLDVGDWLVRATLWEGQRQAQARVPVEADDRELTRDLEFDRRAILTGRVLFNDEPLAEAVLAVRGERRLHKRSITTGYDGSFRLDDLEPDLYWLGVSHPGKLLSHNQWLELEGDRELEIRLEDATVSGWVREAGSGQAVPSALVTLRPTQGPEYLIAAGTEADGSFHLLRVQPAAYRLRISANGFETRDQDIQVTAGQGLAGLEITLNRSQAVRLQVRRASGGVPEMVHLLALAGDGKAGIAETRKPDESGWIELATLPAGQWNLLLAGTRTGAAMQPLTVPGNPVQVTLPDAASLQVRVAELAALDLAATLTLTNASEQPFWTLAPGGQLQQAWSLVGGRATVEGVPAGVWILKVQASNGRVWTGTVTSSGSGEQAVVLE